MPFADRGGQSELELFFEPESEPELELESFFESDDEDDESDDELLDELELEELLFLPWSFL